VTALGALALPILFLVGLGGQASDNTLGPAYTELMQAVRSPGMFRAAWAVDALIWLMLGGFLVTAAGMLRYKAPIRAWFTVVCGAAQLFGALGSILRLDGISDIASHYALASPDQEAALLRSFLDLGRTIDSSNHLAVFFQGAGFLLVAWSVVALRGFPRWLAVWLILPGLLSLTQFGLFITGAPYLFALNVLGLTAGNIALNLAISIALWHPPELLILNLSADL